jgi:L-lysine exporter family protein LysE/ArgO
MLGAAVAGFLLGGGLIVAIGAQNAFVIRQGVIGKHVFLVCLFCALADALLIWSGTYGLSALLKAFPQLIQVMTYGGAAFLVWYGVKALQRALNPEAMNMDEAQSQTLWNALVTCAGFTFLNPHVYLDTVILVGSIANARAAGEQAPFAAGATLASFIWFFALGYAAVLLRPWLARPKVWRSIDFGIAAIMFLLAGKLLLA